MPTGEIFAIEDGPEAIGWSGVGQGKAGEEEGGGNGEAERM